MVELVRRADRRFFNLETTLADAISAAQPIPLAETANSMFPGCCAKTMLAMYDNKTPTPKTSSEWRTVLPPGQPIVRECLRLICSPSRDEDEQAERPNNPATKVEGEIAKIRMKQSATRWAGASRTTRCRASKMQPEERQLWESTLTLTINPGCRSGYPDENQAMD